MPPFLAPDWYPSAVQFSQEALNDELEKIAISHVRLRLGRLRKGKRPMRVDTLLRKEDEGSLYRHTGNDHKIAAVQPVLGGSLTGAEAFPRRKKWELPSRDEMDATPKREDGRGSAATALGSTNFILSQDVGGRERSE